MGPNFVLPLEYVSARWRTFCGCIGFWAVGTMLLAPLAYYITDWRCLTLTCTAISAPVLLTWFWVTESPRWLIQQGRLEEAHKILENVARTNGTRTPEIEKLQEVAAAQKLQTSKQARYSYRDLFRNAHMTKITLITVFHWFVCSGVYYGMSFSVGGLTGNLYLNFFLLALVEIPAIILVVLVNNSLGRKKTVCLFMLVASGSCLVVCVLFICQLSHHPAVTVFALLSKFGISGAWAAAQVFSSELFPTVVRNIGKAACGLGSSFGAFIAPVIVNAAAATKNPNTMLLVPYVTFGCLSLVAAALAFCLPETAKQPLPEALPQRTGCLGPVRWDSFEGKGVELKLNGENDRPSK